MSHKNPNKICLRWIVPLFMLAGQLRRSPEARGGATLVRAAKPVQSESAGLSIEWGRLAADLTGGAGNNATVTVYRLSDAEDAWESVGDTHKSYAPPFLEDTETLPSGDWVLIIKFSDDRWYVVATECSEDDV